MGLRICNRMKSVESFGWLNYQTNGLTHGQMWDGSTGD